MPYPNPVRMRCDSTYWNEYLTEKRASSSCTSRSFVRAECRESRDLAGTFGECGVARMLGQIIESDGGERAIWEE
ncbi:MAG: hypothetical protein IKG18_09245 [Atopobiaceae bacterium]|nr:hypothetical protein [Atopobiaceae bacterium]